MSVCLSLEPLKKSNASASKSLSRSGSSKRQKKGERWRRSDKRRCLEAAWAAVLHRKALNRLFLKAGTELVVYLIKSQNELEPE